MFFLFYRSARTIFVGSKNQKMITQEQMKDARERVEALHRYLAIDDKLIQVEEEQLRTQVPGFWDDAKRAEAQMKKVKALQAWIGSYIALRRAGALDGLLPR